MCENLPLKIECTARITRRTEARTELEPYQPLHPRIYGDSGELPFLVTSRPSYTAASYDFDGIEPLATGSSNRRVE